jgi:hypothetical protein
MYNDFLANPANPIFSQALPFKDLPREKTYQHKDIAPLYVF